MELGSCISSIAEVRRLTANDHPERQPAAAGESAVSGGVGL